MTGAEPILSRISEYRRITDTVTSDGTADAVSQIDGIIESDNFYILPGAKLISDINIKSVNIKSEFANAIKVK